MISTRALLLIAILKLLLIDGNQNPQGTSYPPSQYNFPPPNDPYDPRLQQQPIQQQSAQQPYGGQPPPNPYGNPQQPPGQGNPFQQQQQQQPPNPYGNPPPPRGPPGGMGAPSYGQLTPYGRGNSTYTILSRISNRLIT